MNLEVTHYVQDSRREGGGCDSRPDLKGQCRGPRRVPAAHRAVPPRAAGALLPHARMLPGCRRRPAGHHAVRLAGPRGIRGRASIRTWLYRIATNRCLNALRSAQRRPAKAWDIPHFEPPRADPGSARVVWLEPFPDALLDGAVEGAARTGGPLRTGRGHLLAFVTALQLLPPRQLAVLILRDVVGYHASEVADMLDSTLESVNSALKRARASLQQRLPPADAREAAPAADSAAERALAARFVRAYESADLDSLVAYAHRRRLHVDAADGARIPGPGCGGPLPRHHLRLRPESSTWCRRGPMASRPSASTWASPPASAMEPACSPSASPASTSAP